MAEEKSAPPAPRFTDPFSAMRAEMDRMFDNFSVGRFPSLPSVLASSASNGAMAPSVDVRENDKQIVIEAELPGIEEKDVSVTVHDGLLTVKGEKKFEEKEETENYHMMERRYGSFMRSMRLPDTADDESISAKIDKGVLTVTVAKKPGTEPKERKIEIAAS
ncbi:MAG: Hsp20/alpha crystallin family protein [Hyphomicrobiales bacterium]|nr:Hsp20/alpha crystallin family protein [Hyphomicrobiales bacterium]